MRRPDPPAWHELLALLDPIHDEAVLFARRIARSSAEGDDLFQESLLRAALKLPSLREPARFRPWFYQVVVSVHRSRARRGFWRRLVSSDAPEAAAAVATWAGDDGARAADERAGAARAALALAQLPAAQREAIVLFELQEHTVEDIAEIQRTSISSVKSRLARGRERLRRFYRDEEAAMARASTHPMVQEQTP
ncbi:MAG TPA: RNA polymerase sigma factor [Kofleriaceae bacterium]|nr:RNA polymerase sigma factor [Kofleriaceae bacterium]